MAQDIDNTALLATVGSLSARLAQSQDEKNACYALRYQVFCIELGADHAEVDHVNQLEHDAFDPHYDHIMIYATKRPNIILGTTRVLRGPALKNNFYSQTQFQIDALLNHYDINNLCEVGRTCIASTQRSKRAIETLWVALGSYATRHNLSTYFGSASIQEHEIPRISDALGLVLAKHTSPLATQIQSLRPYNLPLTLHHSSSLDMNSALRFMPPLIRAYIGLGAALSPNLYFDNNFNSLDVFIILRFDISSPDRVNFFLRSPR